MKTVLYVAAMGLGLAAMSGASAGYAQSVSTADQIADRVLNEQTTTVLEQSAPVPDTPVVPTRPPVCLTEAGELPENGRLCAIHLGMVTERAVGGGGGMGTVADIDRGGSRAASAAPRATRSIRVSRPAAAPRSRARPVSVVDTRAAGSCAIEDTVDTGGVNLCLTFALGSADLTSRSKEQLYELKLALETRLAGRRARLEGFADSRGDAVANRDLSLQRAAAVQAYLVASGLDASRFTVEGYGDTRPIDGRPGTHPTNRRVEFRIEG